MQIVLALIGSALALGFGVYCYLRWRSWWWEQNLKGRTYTLVLMDGGKVMDEASLMSLLAEWGLTKVAEHGDLTIRYRLIPADAEDNRVKSGKTAVMFRFYRWERLVACYLAYTADPSGMPLQNPDGLRSALAFNIMVHCRDLMLDQLLQPRRATIVLTHETCPSCHGDVHRPELTEHCPFCNKPLPLNPEVTDCPSCSKPLVYERRCEVCGELITDWPAPAKCPGCMKPLYLPLPRPTERREALGECPQCGAGLPADGTFAVGMDRLQEAAKRLSALASDVGLRNKGHRRTFNGLSIPADQILGTLKPSNRYKAFLYRVKEVFGEHAVDTIDENSPMIDLIIRIAPLV